MTISTIEVSLFPPESALSKYAIKHTTIIFEKRLILGWWVTYMAVKHNQPITEAITKIEHCLTQVTDWYGKNQLKLNTEKSEAVIFLTSKQRNDLPSDISVTIGGHRLVPKPSVRNPGVILDSGLNMQSQVAQIA